MEGRAEWASEGEPKQVGEPELALRQQSQRMVVRVKWARRAKPGGTAGVLFAPVPAFLCGTGAFFCSAI